MTKTKRVFKVTYAWRASAQVTVNTQPRRAKLTIDASVMGEAVAKATRIAQRECKSDGDVFLRVIKIRDHGRLR